MKNLPEENNLIEDRLRAYSEAPAELAWKNIQSAIAPDDDAAGVLWRDRAAVVAIIVFLSWFAFNNFSTPPSSPAKNNPAVSANLAAQNSNDNSELPEQKTRSIEKSSELETSQSNLQNNTDNSGLINSDNNAKVRARSLAGSNPGTASDNSGASASKHSENIASLVDDINFSSAPTLPNQPEVDSSSNKIDSVMLVKKEQKDASVVLNKITPTRKKGLPFTVYGLLTPSLSFLSITPKQNDSYIVQQFQNPSIMSTERLGLSLDMGIQGTITKRLGYVAGVSLYYQKQSYAYSGVRSDGTTFNEQTLNYDPLPFNRTLQYTMLNGGVQGGVMYTLIQSPLTHKIGVAVQYQQGLYHSEGSYNNTASRYFNYQVFYRIELPVGTRTSFILQPSFIAPIKTDETIAAPFSLKQFKAGIGLGFSYKIGDQKKLKTVRPNQSNR